jgi:hypothetical protein
VGAFAEVPTTDIDTSSMIEFASRIEVKVFEGSVYVYEWESATMTRYEVSDSLELVAGPRLSFADAGVTYVDLQFRDAGVAYGVTGDIVVEWDPTAMAVRDVRPTGLPRLTGLPPTLDSMSFVGPERFSGALAWNVYANDGATATYHEAAVVAFLEPDAPAFQLLEEPRCAPNGKSYVIDGDLYVIGANTSAQSLKNYNPDYADAAPDCVARVLAGSRDFDPSYYLDLTELTGSPAIFGTWLADDDHIVAQVWDPDDPLPALQDDYWTAPNFITQLVSISLSDQTVVPFQDVPKGRIANDRELNVDGRHYFQVADADGAGVTMNELSATGLRPMFHAPGNITVLARVR